MSKSDLETRLRTDLTELISDWMDDGGHSYLGAYVGEKTAELAAMAATSVLLAVRDHEQFMHNEGMTKPEIPPPADD